jgi:hypothetical protein
MLRMTTFRLKTEQVTRDKKQSHTKDLQKLNYINIIKVVKSRRKRCIGHTAHMEEMRNAKLWPEIIRGGWQGGREGREGGREAGRTMVQKKITLS